MNPKVMAGGAVVVIAVAAGVVWFNDRDGDRRDVNAGETVVSGNGGTNAVPGGTSVADVALQAQVQELRVAAERSRARLTELETESAGLRKELRAARQENANLAARNTELDQSLRPYLEDQAASLASVVARIDALKDKGLQAFLNPSATQELVADLRKLGAAGVDQVVGMLESGKDDERFLAAMLLEQLGDPRAIDALRDRALEDEAELVANMSSHALALMGDKAAIPALNAIVDKSPHTGAQVNAMFGLCTHGDANGIQQTLEFVRDPEHGRSIKAKLGVGIFLLAKADVMPIVNELVPMFEGSDELMGHAVEYYRKVGTAEARSHLQAMIGNAAFSQTIRDAAMAALNQ